MDRGGARSGQGDSEGVGKEDARERAIGSDSGSNGGAVASSRGSIFDQPDFAKIFHFRDHPPGLIPRFPTAPPRATLPA